jgi:porin
MKIAILLLASTAVCTAETARSRFWTYYDPHPSNAIGTSQWWAGPTLTGDWWGTRNWLDAEGIEFPLSYTNNIAGNPVGGTSAGFTYTDNLSFGISMDFGKLLGWEGASFEMSALNRAGSSLSERNIGNQFTVQQVYGGQTFIFYSLIFEQDLWNEALSIKAGRFSTGDDFASSPLYWLYMNNGIDGNPQALPVNTQFSAYPWAVWAARMKIRPHREFDLQLGAYQVSNRVFDRAYHGMDWSIRSDDGILLIGQAGWSPELFRRRGQSDGKAASAAKNTPARGLPGHYWFGAYWSPWKFAQFGTDATATNSFGFYWHADQMVYREPGTDDEGLTAWSAFVYTPTENIAKVPFQVNGGLAYKGALPGRSEDQAVFGVVYGKFSTDYARATEEVGGRTPDYELVLEWGYRVQLSEFAYVQPDVQWVMNPGGTGRIPNALVLGAQMGVTF